ncbi:OmpL47-type beta-barrel domain-containing protein [Microbacterium sp. B24]|uniref:OmpL47-type beta-barrel domain-containing protein n=1 Tax=Microbacterium sp. B24 TaxID=95616 RepID=UPI000412B408|nr:family 43 glycosylhydrolase [Microbacterium sp. B24]
MIRPASRRLWAAATVVGLMGGLLALTPASPAAALPNPLLGDGSSYSADPATLVADDTLYVYAGRDEADATTNDFVMNEWQAFSTTDVEGGSWKHYPSLMRPEQVFSWATPGRAYAGQVVQGGDGRYYWYVPVHEAGSSSPDPFGIGIAVSDTPLGPWTDYAGGPIVSQKILGNNAHNIDPTVYVTDDGRVWMYWGSFGRLFGVELASDMKTLIGTPTEFHSGVDGFFEAAWLFERKGTYYLAYAANTAGPDSWCTPAVYHACIAYSTGPTPMGPWTSQGRVLAPVSSTTSHPAITEYHDKWYIAYHTADAVGGNHFRRSVAVDEVQWDDSVTPARMKPVVTTPPRDILTTPSANVAPWATVSTSNEPVPVQYWKAALNDGIVRPNPLPPDMWGSYAADRPASQWIQYDWREPVRIDHSSIQFWADREPGSGDGVSAPSSWTLQYWADGRWSDVENPSGYPTKTGELREVTFSPVATTRLRAVLNASPGTGASSSYSALAVEEWTAGAVAPTGVDSAATSTLVGEAPELPDTVALVYGDDRIAAPVTWDAIDPAAYVAPGTFTVNGTAQGYAAGRVQATVTVVGADTWRTNLAATGTPVADFTAGWNALASINDGTILYQGGSASQVWATWDGLRPASRNVGYTWDEPVTVDAVNAHFWSDVPGASGAGNGVAVPASWHVEALVDGRWTEVAGASGYPVETSAPSRVSFTPVTTTGIRVVLDGQSDGTTHAAVGLSELEVLGEPADATAPEITLEARGARGADGWFVGPVTARVEASDDRDLRVAVTVAVDGGAATTSDARRVDTVVRVDGAHTVTARATDAAGNVSTEATASFRIDATAPAVTTTLDAGARSVSATATDAGSGLGGVEYALDTPLTWRPYTAAVAAPDLERHVVYVRATDVAGNVSNPTTVTIPRSPDAPLTGNIAPYATPSASSASGWAPVGGVNDGSVTGTPWGTWPRVGEQWVQLTWDRSVTVDRANVQFARDAADDVNAGLIPPRSWVLQYRDGSGTWKDVVTSDSYARSSDAPNEVHFTAVDTTAVRALMQSWGAAEGQGSAAISEFEVWAATKQPPVDTTAPTLSFEPASPPNSAGWYREGVRFTATATDDIDDAPTVRVRVDGGAWAPFTDTATIDADGTHLVEAEAVDAAGNVSVRQGLTVRVDTVAPSVSTQVADDASGSLVEVVASDQSSGVVSVERRVGDVWSPLTGGRIRLPHGGGDVELAVRATDAAGNTSAPHTVTVSTGTPPVDPDTASVSLGVDAVSAGGAIALVGSGFAPDELVEVDLHSDPLRLGALRADGSGAVRGTLSIPTTVPAGAHTVTLRGATSGREASAEVLVRAAAMAPGATTGVGAAGTVGGGTSGVLASTGATVPSGLVGFALLLLAGGLLTLRAHRGQERPRSTSERNLR